MQGYSFYGGREGRTYHLVQRFDSVAAMVSAFQRGGSYTDVNYHEYVIIDTILNSNQGNNAENGLIYRRGMNYSQARKAVVKKDATQYTTVTSPSGTSRGVYVPVYYNYRITWNGNTPRVEWLSLNKSKFIPEWRAYVEAPGGGAEYVGQIVGPKGDSPEIDLLSWSQFQSLSSTDTKIIKNKEQVIETDLVPGNLTDEITLGYANIIDTDGNILSCVLAFHFPYTIFEWNAKSVSPYGPDIVTATSLPSRPAAGKENSYYRVGSKTYRWDTSEGTGKFVEQATPWTATKNADGSWSYGGMITELSKTKTHPFWQSNEVKIPKGIHGSDTEEYGIHIEDASGAATTPQNVARDANGDIKHTKADGVTPNNNYKLYYRTRDYNNSQAGDLSPEKIIGDFRVVDRITTNRIAAAAISLGTRTQKLNYTLGERVDDSRLAAGLCLLCVEARNAGARGTANITINSDTLLGDTIQDGDIKWRVVNKNDQVEDLTTVHYTIGPDDTLQVRFLDRIEMNEDGRLYAKYGDVTERTLIGQVQDILDVSFDSADSQVQMLRVVYNTIRRDATGNPIIDKDFTFDSQGKITKFPTTDEYGHKVQYLRTIIKFIKKIEWLEATGNVVVTYNDGTSETVGSYRGIRRVYYDEQYNIVVEYNTKQDGTNYDRETLNQFTHTKVNRIWIENDGNLDATKRYKVNYVTGQVLKSDGTKDRDIIGNDQYLDSAAINDIEDMKLIGDCLCVLWGDPTYRNNLTNFFNSTCRDGVSRKWENLGPILAGNHIQGEFASLAALRAAYPYGFGKTTSGAVDNATNNRQGWLATVDNSSGSRISKIIYAYDYVGSRGWYAVQNTSTEFIEPMGSVIVDKEYNDNGSIVPYDTVKGASLQPNGLWFILKE